MHLSQTCSASNSLCTIKPRLHQIHIARIQVVSTCIRKQLVARRDTCIRLRVNAALHASRLVTHVGHHSQPEHITLKCSGAEQLYTQLSNTLNCKALRLTDEMPVCLSMCSHALPRDLLVTIKYEHNIDQ